MGRLVNAARRRHMAICRCIIVLTMAMLLEFIDDTGVLLPLHFGYGSINMSRIVYHVIHLGASVILDIDWCAGRRRWRCTNVDCRQVFRSKQAADYHGIHGCQDRRYRNAAAAPANMHAGFPPETPVASMPGHQDLLCTHHQWNSTGS